MADEQKDVMSVPQQSEDALQAVLDKSSAGGSTAVGSAREVASGKQAERIKNLDSRGSTQPIAGEGDLGPDYAQQAAKAPSGAQAQPAAFTTNGSLQANFVGSPSGPIPVSALTGDVADAQRRVEETLKSHDEFYLTRGGFKKLTRQQVETMSPADLRAVASDRGYDVGQAGSRVTRQRFLAAQAKDENISQGDTPAGDNPETESGS